MSHMPPNSISIGKRTCPSRAMLPEHADPEGSNRLVPANVDAPPQMRDSPCKSKRDACVLPEKVGEACRSHPAPMHRCGALTLAHSHWRTAAHSRSVSEEPAKWPPDGLL